MVVHSALPEVYTSVTGLDIYLVEVYALPQFCVNFMGEDTMVYLI